MRAAAALSLLAHLACAAAAPFPPTPQMQQDAAAIIALATTGAGNTTAYDRLAYATDTFGPRLSGSSALNAFIDYVAATAAADGLTVTRNAVSVPHWVRGVEWARLEAPRAKALHFCGAGYSNGTGGLPVTAEVLVVASNEELQARLPEAKGKIILFDWAVWEGYGTTVSFRYNAATWAAAAGGVGALFKSITPWGLQTCHTGVSAPAGVAAGAVSHEDALQMRRMAARGQTVVVTMYMEAALAAPVESANLLLDYVRLMRTISYPPNCDPNPTRRAPHDLKPQVSPGAAFPDEYVIVSGHLDSWDIAEGGA